MFAFSTCQVGAESVLKKEAMRMFPDACPAFARPGFVTFKTATRMEGFNHRSIFSRTFADSLGKIEAHNRERLAAEIWNIACEHRLFVNRVHVFRRDPLPVGEQGFEPHLPLELVDIHRQIVEQSPTTKFFGTGADDIFHPAQPGETVLDVAMVEPHLFFVGTHSIIETSPIHARYSGGILPMVLSADVISRAYHKFNEGFLWSGLVPRSDDQCLDIGASPGGCSQLLLHKGMRVLGVDPGEIHPAVLNHPRFTHVRCRIKDARRALFRDVRWITADMNVAPNYTLDVLEEIITKTPSVRGILFTLKLIRWELADSLPMLLDRIRMWGHVVVQAKQLVFNRQEVMVAVRSALT